MAHHTIVVVNHDVTFLNLMTTLLEQEGYETLVQRNHADAYNLIKSKQPTLVILDLHLENPQPSWSVLDLIRLDPETKHIPAIVTSTDEASMRAKQDTLAEQNIDWLAKPFDLDNILAKIRSGIEHSLVNMDGNRP